MCAHTWDGAHFSNQYYIKRNTLSRILKFGTGGIIDTRTSAQKTFMLLVRATVQAEVW